MWISLYLSFTGERPVFTLLCTGHPGPKWGQHFLLLGPAKVRKKSFGVLIDRNVHLEMNRGREREASRERRVSKERTSRESIKREHRENTGAFSLKCPASAMVEDDFGAAFSFIAPSVRFGRGIASEALSSSLDSLGLVNPLVVTGTSGLKRYVGDGSLSQEVFARLEGFPAFRVLGEPTVDMAAEAVNLMLCHKCDSVVSIGGGSAIDLGKAASALSTNISSDSKVGAGDVLKFVEVIGQGCPISKRPVPFLAVSTTSGTGSEVTKNAVLKCLVKKQKASMRHNWMLPTIAIVDPVLTKSCPSRVTSDVGLDTLCQVIEPFVSKLANPVVDALAREGIKRASRSLRRAVSEPANLDAREDMSIASMLGGLCLANAKLGTVHGYAGVIGGMYDHAPHGAICGRLLPGVFQANARKLSSFVQAAEAATATTTTTTSTTTETPEQRDGISLEAACLDPVTARRRLQRFSEVAKIVTGDPNASIAQGVMWMDQLVLDLQVPGLSALCGMQQQDMPRIAAATSGASSTKGNPVELNLAELEAILLAAL